MADYTITASNVVPTVTSRDTLLAGEAITAGQAIYKKTSDGKAWKAQSDGTAEEATVIGVALNSASTGQPVAYQSSGVLACGSAFTAAGATVCVSNTAGALCPVADVTTGRRLSVVGYSASATSLSIDLKSTGITVG